MIRKLYFLFLLLITNSYIFSNQLVNEEKYYNRDKSVFQGRKIYTYDNQSNISCIKVYNSDNIEESRIEYIYEGNTLLTAIEYNGKTKIKYSEFLYSSKDIIKKIEFDIQGKVLLIHNFIYENNKIICIEDYNTENKYIGKKEFIYSNDKLSEEKIYDETNKIIMLKKYKHLNNNISDIEYYLSGNKLIRIIERTYLNEDKETNIFGFRSNYFDMR